MRKDKKHEKRLFMAVLTILLAVSMVLAGVSSVRADDEKRVWCPNPDCPRNKAFIDKHIRKSASGSWFVVTTDDSGRDPKPVTYKDGQKEKLQAMVDDLNDNGWDSTEDLFEDYGLLIREGSDNICDYCNHRVDYASSEDGETGSLSEDQPEITTKSAQQKWFEEHLLVQVLNMNAGESEGSLSTVTLLERTFVYAIAIMEGADKVPPGYLDEDGLAEGLADYRGMTREPWYLFLEVAAMLIMLIRFAADYSMDRVWQPSERNTPEQLFKPIFRLICGFLFILCAHHFLALGLYLSQAAFSAIAKSTLTPASVSLYEEMCSTISEMLGFKDDSVMNMAHNIGVMVMGMFNFFIPYLISMVSGLGVIFIVFSRVLELVVRALFAPLAMTDCYKNGEHTHGFRYILEFFGICFQSLAIFAVLWVSGMICGMFAESLKASADPGSINSITQLTIYISGLKLAQLTMLMKTATLSKAVFS